MIRLARFAETITVLGAVWAVATIAIFALTMPYATRHPLPRPRPPVRMETREPSGEPCPPEFENCQAVAEPR